MSEKHGELHAVKSDQIEENILFLHYSVGYVRLWNMQNIIFFCIIKLILAADMKLIILEVSQENVNQL